MEALNTIVPFLFPLFSLWGLGILLLLLRRDFGLSLRLLAIAVFLVFLSLTYVPLERSYLYWTTDPAAAFHSMRYFAPSLLLGGLLLLWPVQLIVIFYKADVKGAGRILWFMVVLSLLFLLSLWL